PPADLHSFPTRRSSDLRQVMLSSGRSNTTPFVSSTVKTVATELMMRGSADFPIEISSEERVETAAAGKPPAKTESRPSGTPVTPDRKSTRLNSSHDQIS